MKPNNIKIGYHYRRQRVAVAADAQDDVDIMFGRKLFQIGEQPFKGRKVVANEIHEAVDVHIFEIKILRGDAAKEPIEHLGRFNAILRCIDKPDAGIEVKHVAVIVIDKHQAALCARRGAVGMLQKLLRFPCTFLSENDSYQGRVLQYLHDVCFIIAC